MTILIVKREESQKQIYYPRPTMRPTFRNVHCFFNLSENVSGKLKNCNDFYEVIDECADNIDEFYSTIKTALVCVIVNIAR